MKVKRMYSQKEINDFVIADEIAKHYPHMDYEELKASEYYTQEDEKSVYFQLNVDLEGPEDEPVFVYGSGKVGNYMDFKEDILKSKKTFALYFEDTEDEYITEISENSFGDLPVTHILFSSHIKKIGESAFANCKYLDSLVIPEGLEIIEKKAFENCTSLKNIILPRSLKYISNDAFGGCGDIEIITNKQS